MSQGIMFHRDDASTSDNVIYAIMDGDQFLGALYFKFSGGRNELFALNRDGRKLVLPSEVETREQAFSAVRGMVFEGLFRSSTDGAAAQRVVEESTEDRRERLILENAHALHDLLREIVRWHDTYRPTGSPAMVRRAKALIDEIHGH